jgi:hypothetical protein
VVASFAAGITPRFRAQIFASALATSSSGSVHHIFRNSLNVMKANSKHRNVTKHPIQNMVVSDTSPSPPGALEIEAEAKN